jgi:uncharacterized protein with PQ loop repeat
MAQPLFERYHLFMFPFFHRLMNNDEHHHTIDYLADANSVISAIALYPQLFALLRNSDHAGVSSVSFILIAINSCIWFVYGVHRHAPPLVISSFANALAAFGILALLFHPSFL